MKAGASFGPRSCLGDPTGRLVAVASLLATALLLVTLSPGVSASPYGGGDSVQWTNGLVLCQFAPSVPAVNVSALSLTESGVAFSLLNISEMRPDQSVAAVANLTGLVWSVSNLSTEGLFDLAYSGRAALVSASGSPPVVGSANLAIDFILPAYQGSGSGPTDTVTVFVSVTHWTWQAADDHLTMTFGAAPNFPTREHLTGTSVPGWLLASTSNASGSTLERIGVNTHATATTSTSSNTTIDANASLLISSPASARVTVTFGASAGAYTALTFYARVGIVLPTTVAGVPVLDLSVAGSAAILLSLLIAAITRRLRKTPSKLVYVNGEESP